MILGMHRSGTSATARLINMMGAFFGRECDSIGRNQYNPKGFWERKDAMRLNDDLLDLQNCRWDQLADWQFDKAAGIPPQLARRLQDLLLVLDENRPWFLKDPRLCLLLPQWLPYLEAPLAVLVYRDPMEITLSLQKRDGMPPAYGLALWEYYAVGMLNATMALPRFFVPHGALLRDPMDTCERIHGWLTGQGTQRLSLPGELEIRDFIDPTLYRSKPIDLDGLALSTAQRMQAEILQGLAPQRGPVHVSPDSLTTIRAGLPR